ncbi:MAG: S1 RNA-binding domain-containing protein [Gemmataceae bacterium]|nr:S1 RNA-binding domain-containing protein [Gemmataceae bacterium]
MTDETTNQPLSPIPPKPRPNYNMGRAGKVFDLQHTQNYGGGVGGGAREWDDQIEKELAEAMAGMTESDLLGGEPAPKRTKGQPTPATKTGKVFRIHDQDVFIELPGGRTQGLLSILQFPEGKPEIGMDVEVKIEGFDGQNGLLLLSRKGAVVSNASWDTVAVGMVVEARVTGVNKGGLEVDVHGLRGFMPISQIEMFRVMELEPYLNQKINCMVTEVEPFEQNLVLSRRDLLERERAEAREKLWLELAEGQVRDGIVGNVQQFGAFIDLGGVDGLLHISEMSWSRTVDASKLFQPGQKVKVVVLRLDLENRKVALGFKQLEGNPWDDFSRDNRPGAVMNGKVTRLADFGAFIELAPGIEGLAHISELSKARVRRTGDVLKIGQEVQVKVLSIDADSRKISLSIKALEAAPVEPEAPEEPAKPVKPSKPRTTPLRGGTSPDSKPLFG